MFQSAAEVERMDKKHKKILTQNHFEDAGTIEALLKRDEFDGSRVLYAIIDPTGERIVYIGDTETGRDVRSRLKAHLNDRSKIGLVEKDSGVWIHFMITEFKVLCDFEDATGAIPELNKRKIQK